MDTWQKWSPTERAGMLLRVGLAAVFIYAAISSLVQPSEWLGYLPPFLLHLSFAPSILVLLSIGQLLLALWLLTNWYVRYAALLCVAMFIGIILAQPSVLNVTFRDVGLLFMALALFVLDNPKSNPPKH